MENFREFFIWMIIGLSAMFATIAILVVWEVIAVDGLLEKSLWTLGIFTVASVSTYYGLGTLDNAKKQKK